MDISIRNVVSSDADALAHILVTAEEHVFRGLVPDKCLEFTEAESAANWQTFFVEGMPKADFMIVAETATHQAVGYAWSGPTTNDTQYAGELRQISVLPAYQGFGIGRLLVADVARRLAEQNIYSLKVEVLQVNPNRLFYEHLGATFVSQHLYNWDGITLPACVYGWSDTRGLLSEQC